MSHSENNKVTWRSVWSLKWKKTFFHSASLIYSSEVFLILWTETWSWSSSCVDETTLRRPSWPKPQKLPECTLTALVYRWAHGWLWFSSNQSSSNLPFCVNEVFFLFLQALPDVSEYVTFLLICCEGLCSRRVFLFSWMRKKLEVSGFYKQEIFFFIFKKTRNPYMVSIRAAPTGSLDVPPCSAAFPCTFLPGSGVFSLSE